MTGPLTRLGYDLETREQRQEKVLAGLIASVYRQVPQSVLGSIVGGFAIVVAFWHTHDQTLLVGWAVFALLECLIRTRVAYQFRHAADAVGRVHVWARRWVALAAISGAVWGAAGLLFFSPEAPDRQLVLMAVIMGVAFGSLTLYATHRAALWCFLPLALLPLIVRMAAEGTPTHVTVAIVMSAVFAFAMFFGRYNGQAMFDSIKNNYENEVLVASMTHEKKVADDARRAAETATRSKTQFFAAASHDLRQPLQAIGIYVSLLKKRAQGPTEQLVNNLSSAVESLSKLVEELLEISRLDSGSIQPRTQEVFLDDMFGALEQEFMAQAATKGLALRVRRSGYAVETDQILLLRVLRNLLANAIKYTGRGGILLAARPRGGLVSIEVWDTGPGIKQQELDRVFEEFYRGESSKGDGGRGGFGLGLSIVKRICSVLGHPLIVTTRPGTGTVFRVEVTLSSAPSRRPSGAAEVVELEIRALTGQTIVVLEDHEEILNSLTKLLRSWGAETLSSTSFNASLVKKLSVRGRISLIIADQNLGNAISGVESTFRIRELIGFPVPVILLTAAQGLDVIAEFQHVLQARLARNGESASAIARSRVEEPIVLQKPTTPALLNATIAAALGLATMPAIEVRPSPEGALQGLAG